MQLTEIPLKEEQYTLYIDRKLGNIYGVLTLQRAIAGKTYKLFERLPFASGQPRCTLGGKQDWIQNCGPIPMSKPGENYWLSTKRETLNMEPKGTPFYVISSRKGERTIIGEYGEIRGDIGLHLENQFPGSYGCPALLHDTAERKRLAWLLFDELDRLYAAGIKYIKVVVL